jgi:hypothetical protein
LDIKIDEAIDTEKQDQLKDDKTQYLAQIEALKQQYLENLELMGHDNQAVTAFVLFRSMEGVERSIHAY